MSEFGESEALTTRTEQVLSVLNNPELNRVAPPVLKELWLDELEGDLGKAISRAREKGLKYAMVIQYGDAFLHSAQDETFADKFLQQFGAVVDMGDFMIKVRSRTLPQIMSLDGVSRVGRDDLETADEGSLFLEDGDRITYLVCGTQIDGVRLMMDGSAITALGSSFRSLRPMLVVKVGE